MPIKRIDMKPYLTKANALREQGRGLDADVIVETLREKIQLRLGHGEHLHLYADDVEECINPGDLCWEGPRNVRRT